MGACLSSKAHGYEDGAAAASPEGVGRAGLLALSLVASRLELGEQKRRESGRGSLPATVVLYTKTTSNNKWAVVGRCAAHCHADGALSVNPVAGSANATPPQITLPLPRDDSEKVPLQLVITLDPKGGRSLQGGANFDLDLLLTKHNGARALTLEGSKRQTRLSGTMTDTLGVAHVEVQSPPRSALGRAADHTRGRNTPISPSGGAGSRLASRRGSGSAAAGGARLAGQFHEDGQARSPGSGGASSAYGWERRPSNKRIRQQGEAADSFSGKNASDERERAQREKVMAQPPQFLERRRLGVEADNLAALSAPAPGRRALPPAGPRSSRAARQSRDVMPGHALVRRGSMDAAPSAMGMGRRSADTDAALKRMRTRSIDSALSGSAAAAAAAAAGQNGNAASGRRKSVSALDAAQYCRAAQDTDSLPGAPMPSMMRRRGSVSVDQQGRRRSVDMMVATRGRRGSIS